MKLAIFPLARSTFDMALAEQVYSQKMEVLNQLNFELICPQNILLDEDDAEDFIQYLSEIEFDAILILQLTFRDAETICKIGSEFEHPITIWATNEPRDGDRLRLNSFCGLNLASHALGLRNRDFNWIYKNPSKTLSDDLISALDGIDRKRREFQPTGSIENHIRENKSTETFKIGLLGQHPPGFDTCKYTEQSLENIFNTKITQFTLDELFTSAETSTDEEVNQIRESISQVVGLDEVDQKELKKSLKLKLALEDLQEKQSLDAFAIRCWPETFTKYGAAICGPVSLMGEKKVPCACEADVMGALSQLYLQKITQEPTFLVDLVDMDVPDDTGVVWHCGQAPFSMSNPSYDIEATVHTNRKKPLLFQFPLKKGDITLFRITQSLGSLRVIRINGEVLDKPMAYTGTSGVIKFDKGVEKVLEGLIEERIEHHLVLAYGRHDSAINTFASGFGLSVLEL
ncbi:MAG: hypothetical protein F4073_00515 [Rhodobacteraceae bacterium]|nr:hypothetical protein [Paracoccaceae bacterium]MYF47163.1 hypothetical protein [Paracoccaceae bacterium]MYI90418.1 hypothetical protein [Paracoccaceae bacterium]